MDLKIQTDLSTLPSVIEFNFEELKSEIKSSLVKYNNLVVTENGIKDAKSDKAKLNKFITVIEDKRKELKKQCLEPYNDFEKKCKELVSLIKAPIDKIDTQIKEFEEIKKQKKYDDLKSCFDNYIGDMADIIQLDKILNPKWGNATVKIDTLKAEIEDNIDRIKKELETLNTEYADKSYKAAVISEYCKEYSMSKALIYAAQLKYDEEMQKKLLKKKKSETIKPKINSENSNCEAARQVESNPMIGGGFVIKCLKSKLILLKKFISENEIDIIGTLTLADYEKFKKYKEENKDGSK